MSEREDNLPFKALKFSLSNMLHAFGQSPLSHPGFKIGKVVGVDTVRIGEKIVTINDVPSKDVLNPGSRVIVYQQGLQLDDLEDL